jgi:DNA-binding IclR family transcriptional regulator
MRTETPPPHSALSSAHDSVGGAQTVDRACELLREVARSGARGVRLLDLCVATGLSRPTTHRILRSLLAAGLVQQSADTRRYALGSGMFELGMAAPNPIARFPQVRSIVEELAVRTDDTVYLMLRSYEDVLCAWRAQGAYPIKANVVALGDRRPLGASVAGLGILGALPADESDALVDGSRELLPQFCRMTAEDVKRHVHAARLKGYAIGVHAVMEGVTAVGMAVPSSYGRPFMGLSVSAIASRIPPDRTPELVALLGEYTQRIADVIGSSVAAR